MQIWLLAIFIGCLAGVFTPLAWWMVYSIGESVSSMVGKTQNSIVYSVLTPSIACFFIFLLIAGSKAFRSADGFTYFISDLHFQDGRRKLRYSLVHGFSTLFLLIGQGIVGVEGFLLEILSAIGSRLGVALKLSVNQVRTLAACGATASIAALLGQPTAAFLFIVELLYGWGSVSFSVGTYALTAFTAASVAQSMMSPGGYFKTFFGTDAGLSLAFRGDDYSLTLESALLSFVIVSISAGLLAAGNIWLYKKTDKDLHELFETRRSTDISGLAFGIRIGIWGILTAFALYFFPLGLGVGVQLLQDSLTQDFLFQVCGLAILLRMLMGALSYSVTGTMGLILPTLVLGGLLGSCITIIFKQNLSMHPGAVALLSVGAYFSASFGTPVAATALVFGYASGLMADSALFLFTALLTNFVAHFICGYLQVDRLASMGLYRHGIRFRRGMCYNTLSGIQVSDAMITYVQPIARTSSIGEAYKKLMESKFSKLPVVDTQGRMHGLISLGDFYGLDAWKRLGEESQVHNLVGVEDMLKPAQIKVRPDMNLETALQSMSDEEIVPVVENEDHYVGILLKSDLVNLYNKEVVKKAFRR